MIINTDCIEYMKGMQENSVYLTLTDVPYGVVSRESNGLRNLDKKDADVLTFDLEQFLDEVYRVTQGSVYIFCGTEQVSFIREKMVEQGMSTRLCILKKSNPSPMNGDKIWLSGIECCVFGKKKGATFNEHCKNPVWEYPCVKNKRHPTEKPLTLFEYLVKVSSNPGDLVFDPCCGSGTTLVAAKKNNRKYLGIDLNKEYCRVAQQRLEEV